MKGFGTFALIVGICWLIFALSMDVSVATGAGGRVNNLGLMADRQVHVIVGGMIALAGLLMVLLGGKGSPAAAQEEKDTRPCPMCAESIRAAAVKCKHCGADVEAVAALPPTTGAGDITITRWALAIPCRKESDRELAMTTAEPLRLPSLPAHNSFVKFGPFASKAEAGESLRRMAENGVHGNIEEIRGA